MNELAPPAPEIARARLAAPPGTSTPGAGVLVLGGADEAELVLATAERLSCAGHAALALELTPAALRSDRVALRGLARARTLLAQRPEVDGERLFALGFARGGTLAFLLACAERLAGAIDVEGPVLHPELSPENPTQPLELALNLEGAFLAVFAGRSARVPAPEIELLRARLSSAARPFDIVLFPEAGEGFYDRRRPGFDARRAADLEGRILSFLQEISSESER